MKQRVCLLGLLLFLIGCQAPIAEQESPKRVQLVQTADEQDCCGGQPEEQPTPPEAGLVQKSIGEVQQGDTVTAEFEFENTGSDPAKLDGEPKFSLSCCVKVKVEPTTLAPGDKGKLAVTFDSKWQNGQTEIFVTLPFVGGTVAKSFLVEANVKPLLSVEPTLIDLSTGVPQEFVVSGEGLFKDINIKSVSSDDPRLKVVELEKTDHSIVYEAQWASADSGDKTVLMKVVTDYQKIDHIPVKVTPPGL